MAKRERITVREAVDRYIKAKSAVLSPSTVAGYTRYKRLYLQDIFDKNIYTLTQEEFQLAVSIDATKFSPKTIRNACGLVNAAIKMFTKRELSITMPQKVRTGFYVPEKEEIDRIYLLIKGTELEIPFLLASQCGLRPSEIAALTIDDIIHDKIEITKAKVRGIYGDVVKPPKTFSGYRTIPISEEFARLLRDRSIKRHVTDLTAKQIGDKWIRFMNSNDLEYFRFYALRHYFASRALLLGVPQKYIAELMGHSSLAMIEQVYQHTFPSAMLRYSMMISKETDDLINLKK